MKVEKVVSEEQRKEFVEFQARLFADDPNYIRPLDKDIRDVFDPKKNKFFRFGECERFVFMNEENVTVGKIAIFINKKYKQKQLTGGIGFFDCINDQESADFIFDFAKNQLQEKGMQAMDGPINFGERDKFWGLLIEGFSEPLYAMNYNAPYYKDLFENYGFGKNSNFDFITDYKKYNFTIEKALTYNDELVYVLHFEPNKGGSKYSGEIYVSADTYAVLKAKYTIADGKRGQKINLKLLLGIKYEELNREVLIIFNKNQSNSYSLKYLKTKFEQYMYINRSFTFIENSKDRSDRMKLKLDILSEGINTTEDELLVIDSTPLTSSDFNKIKQKKKIAVEIIDQYDPSLWSNYTIITPDQAIKDFEN